MLYVVNGAVAAAIMKMCNTCIGVIDVVKLAFGVTPLVSSQRAVGLTALGES